ncbi:MAG: HD domain-containing protein, partial [Gemmatimonadota bacterium]
MTEATAGNDASLRQSGRMLLVGIHGAQRALRLYPLENAAVQRALDDLVEVATQLCHREGAIEIRLSGDVIFVNQTRLRLGLDNFAAFSGFVATLKSCGIGVLHIEEGIARREWQAYLSILAALPAGNDAEERLALVQERMERAEVTHLTIGPPTDAAMHAGDSGVDDGLERAKRTYARGVAAARDVVQGVRMGRMPSTRRLKRAIQAIVDQVMDNELSLTGLTTLREYDEYTFTHSVNVCIFAVALGKRLGFDRLQLYDLGLAALLHDMGKARLDAALLNKSSGLDDSEWRVMQAHPWLGTL